MLFVEPKRNDLVALKKKVVSCECCLCVYLNWEMGMKEKTPSCLWLLGKRCKTKGSWLSRSWAILRLWSLALKDIQSLGCWCRKFCCILFFSLEILYTESMFLICIREYQYSFPPVALCNLDTLCRIWLQLTTATVSTQFFYSIHIH